MGLVGNVSSQEMVCRVQQCAVLCLAKKTDSRSTAEVAWGARVSSGGLAPLLLLAETAVSPVGGSSEGAAERG